MRFALRFGALLALAACNVASPITRDWTEGRWQSTDGDVAQVVEMTGSTLRVFIEGQAVNGGRSMTPDVLLVEQYRVTESSDSRCLALRTDGAQRVIRMRFHEPIPASADMVALTRGRLDQGPDRELRVCRDGDILRLISWSIHGDETEQRFTRIESINALSLSPPSRETLMGSCGLTCDPQSSRFNSCFNSCQRAVENLPPLFNDAPITRVTVPANSLRQLEFEGVSYELDVNRALAGVSNSRWHSYISGSSKDDLTRAVLSGSVTPFQFEALQSIDQELRTRGETGFIRVIGETSDEHVDAVEVAHSETHADNTHTAERVVTGPRWIARPEGVELARYYPERAQELGIGGSATVECAVSAAGSLSCDVTAEEPIGYGFGEAALRVARTFRVAPAMVDGVPSDGGRIRQTLRWLPPAESRAN